MADLVDLIKFKKSNKGYQYLLVVIDILSKHCWLRALKNKTGNELKNAFEDIFKVSNRQPKILQTDKGTEFLNSKVRAMLASRKIKLITTFSERKASVVERLNRTLKSIMWKYFTYANTRKYIDILPELSAKYNNSFHRSIKMKPVDVNVNNADLVWMNLYDGRLVISKNRIERKIKTNNLSKGDFVRISIARTTFRKAYNQGWTEEIFMIKNVLHTFPVMYKIKDQANEDIKGSFYFEELQKVSEPQTYRIEKVIRRRKDKSGKTWCLVKWKGYDSSFNSYVKEEDIEQL